MSHNGFARTSLCHTCVASFHIARRTRTHNVSRTHNLSIPPHTTRNSPIARRRRSGAVDLRTIDSISQLAELNTYNVCGATNGANRRKRSAFPKAPCERRDSLHCIVCTNLQVTNSRILVLKRLSHTSGRNNGALYLLSAMAVIIAMDEQWMSNLSRAWPDSYRSVKFKFSRACVLSNTMEWVVLLHGVAGTSCFLFQRLTGNSKCNCIWCHVQNFQVSI